MKNLRLVPLSTPVGGHDGCSGYVKGIEDSLSQDGVIWTGTGALKSAVLPVKYRFLSKTTTF